MSEARRQQYLKAMGIPVWYSRFLLPGAPASFSYDFSGFETVSAGNESNLIAQPIKNSMGVEAKAAAFASLSGLRSLHQEKREPSGGAGFDAETTISTIEKDVAPVQERAPVVGFSAAYTGEGLDFTISLFRLPNSIAFCAAHRDTDSHRESALLANLAAAVWGADVSVDLLFEFTWPVFGNKRLMGQGVEVARNSLLSLVKARAMDVSRCIIFGQLPIAVVDRAETEAIGSICHDRESAWGKVSVLTTWSLGELLLDPRRKKDVWLHLQSFLTNR